MTPQASPTVQISLTSEIENNTSTYRICIHFSTYFFLGDLVLIACRAVGVIVLPWTQGEFNVFSYGLQAIGLDD